MTMRGQGPDDVVAVGITQVEGLVRGPVGGPVSVNFLVDSGAKYTLLPRDVWVGIGLEATRAESFALADGSIIRRRMSECHVEFPWGAGHTPVILGEPGDDVALLGSITLEEFGLVLDPLRRSLRKARMLLLSAV